MKTLVIVGDPGNISGSLNAIYKNNPKLEVVATAASNYFLQLPPSKVLGPLGQPPQPQLLQSFYLTFDGVEVLVDEHGNVLEGQ